MRQTGFGLAVAMLIDATLIGGVPPATMKLLGDWKWRACVVSPA